MLIMAVMNETTKNLIKTDKACVWHPFTQMAGWVDYMHLANMGDRWVIVNVLWEPKPKTE